MPQFTQTVRNPNSLERNQQNLQNLINSANQFAGVMYNIQQAKQAELVKEITVKSSIISALPKNLQLKAAEDILLPIVNKAYPNFKIDKSLFNQQGVDNFTKFVEGAKKIENPVDRQTYWATGMDMFSDPQQKAIEQIEKSIAQAKLAENVATLQGQGQTKQVPFAKGIPTEQTPEFPFRTALDIPRPQDALNALGLSKEGRDIIPILTPKEKTGGKWFVNADTGERKAFYPGDKMVGNWYELGGQPKPDKITVSKIGRNGEVSTKEISPVNLGEHLRAGWAEGKITGVESALDIEGKQLNNTLKRQAKQANKTKAVLSKSPYYADAYKMTAEKHKDIPAAFDEADRIKQYADFVKDLEQNVQLLERRFQPGKQPAPKTPPSKGRKPLGSIFGR